MPYCQAIHPHINPLASSDRGERDIHHAVLQSQWSSSVNAMQHLNAPTPATDIHLSHSKAALDCMVSADLGKLSSLKRTVVIISQPGSPTLHFINAHFMQAGITRSNSTHTKHHQMKLGTAFSDQGLNPYQTSSQSSFEASNAASTWSVRHS